MEYLIPDKVYNALKWGCLIVLPALATLIGTIGQAWGMDADLSSAIATTITAIGTFGGVVLGVSSAAAKVKSSGADNA